MLTKGIEPTSITGTGLTTATTFPIISPKPTTDQVDGGIASEGEKETTSGDGQNKGAIIGYVGKYFHTQFSLRHIY